MKWKDEKEFKKIENYILVRAKEEGFSVRGLLLYYPTLTRLLRSRIVNKISYYQIGKIEAKNKELYSIYLDSEYWSTRKFKLGSVWFNMFPDIPL